MNAREHDNDWARPRRLRSIACAAGIVAAVLVAYWPAYRAGFVWDDDAHVTRPELRSLHGLWRIWFDLGATQQYYPVLHSAFWIEHRLWGDSALGYHLLNVLLHAMAACLFALVLRRLWSHPAASLGASDARTGIAGHERGPPVGAEWLAAVIFALHPVCVESVAWISEQKNTLSTVLYLLAALAFLRWRGIGTTGAGTGSLPVRNGPRGRAEPADGQAARPHPYWLATGLFVLAVLTKSVTATLPAALLVALWWHRGRLSWKRDGLPLAPWLAFGAVAGTVTAWVERRYIGAQGAQFDLHWAERCLIAGRAACFYFGKLVWPVQLLFVYPRWSIETRAVWEWLYPAAIIAVLSVLVARRFRGPLAGTLCFLGTLFPALGFFNVYPFVFSYVADHFQYLASLGMIALAAAGWGTWHGKAGLWRRTGSLAIAAAAILLLGALSWRQCRVYRDQLTLYSATLEGNPDCWLAHDNLGIVLAQSGRVDEAIAHYQEALRLKPDYPEAYNNLGNALARMGRWSEATLQYAAAVRVRPGFLAAEFDWGNALSDGGRYAEAAVHYENALRIRQEYPEAEYKMANALANSGRLAEAMAHYAQAIRLQPDYPEAEANLGLALATVGRPAEALAHLERAVRLKPEDAEAHAYFGFALARAGRYSEAVDEYRQSLRLHADNADAHYQLGVALKALGRLSEAAEEFAVARRAANGKQP
jgi:tetratricopeptide (TPR) repeat protein